MINYDTALLGAFSDTEEILSYGAKVQVKPVPDSNASGIDPREKAIYLKSMENYKAPETIKDHRDATGFPGLNLNTKTILTEKFTLSCEGRDVDIWEYRLRRTKHIDNAPALIYIHGGSFFAGSAKFMENMCKYVCEKADCVVYNIEYSLAPELPFPAGFNDCMQVLQYIHSNASELGIDKNKICVSGDSAGAGLAASVALCDTKKRVRYMALLYPCVLMDVTDEQVVWDINDFDIPENESALIIPRLSLGRGDGKGNEAFMRTIGQMYLGDNHSLCFDKRVSPLRTEDVSHAPKTTVFTAEYDGLRPQGEAFAGKLQAAGIDARCVRYKGVFHAFSEKLGYVPQAQDSLDEIAKDILSL